MSMFKELNLLNRNQFDEQGRVQFTARQLFARIAYHIHDALRWHVHPDIKEEISNKITETFFQDDFLKDIFLSLKVPQAGETLDTVQLKNLYSLWAKLRYSEHNEILIYLLKEFNSSKMYDLNKIKKIYSKYLSYTGVHTKTRFDNRARKIVQ